MLTLGHAFRADAVEALLDQVQQESGYHDDRRAMRRGRARALIHAVLWLYSVRSDSTSAAYAASALDEAAVGADWFERRHLARALGLNPDATRLTSFGEVARMRLALGLNPNPWTE